jgi:quinolinate synthase
MEEKLRKLARERNAVILAHNYEPPEIQDIADLCGDSLELSIRAAETEADVIVFCGVHFMAETASILSPDKTVLLPRSDAGCPMADMVTPEALEARLAGANGIPVVSYVNTSAAVKALSTVCCTSANAVEVVNSLPDDEILMVPDRNLAAFVADRTRKTIRFWDGYCPFHDRLTATEVEAARAARPEAVFMAHPECRREIQAMAEVVTSTSGMIRYARESVHTEFIVGTEVGLLYPLRRACPDKAFFPASERMYCGDMKKIGIADIVRSLEEMRGEVKVPEAVRVPALAAVERMLALSR